MTRTRRRLRRCAFAAAVVAGLVAPPAALAALRIANVDLAAYPLVRLTVVTPSSSTPAPSVTENGGGVQGLSAQRAPGKSVVVAIDRSVSMEGAPLAHAAAAASAFIDSKAVDDRIAVVSFGATALQLTSFSDATIDADQALRGLAIDVHQGTALNDALGLAARMLSTEPSRVRVVVLLTDGRDTISQAGLRQAIALARADRVAVYAIGVHSPQFDPGPLQEMSRETGGTYYPATTPHLDAAYRQIAADLRRTWLLEYSTAARPGDRLVLRAFARGAGSGSSTVLVPVTKATRTSPGSSSQGWLGPALLALLGALVVFVAVRQLQARSAANRLRHQMGPYTEQTTLPPARRFEPDRWRRALAPLFRTTERVFSRGRLWTALETKLVRADVPFRTAELFWAMVACGVLVAVIVGGVSGLGFWVALPFFLLGMLVPYAVVSIKGQRRQRAFEAQLPTALTSLAASLSAGHSFTQALQGLVENAAPPLESEFRRVLTDTRLGTSLDTALLSMGQRVASKDLDFVVRAVIVQRQVGGSLAGLFELVADTVEKRQQFRVKVRSLTAMGRLSATVLVALPFLVALAVTAVNPSYLSPLFNTKAGEIMLIVGGTMVVIGSLILRRMVNMKV